MITGCADSAVRVFQIDNGHLMFSLYGHSGSVDFIEVCDDYITTAGSDRYVMIYLITEGCDDWEVEFE